jgi:hypothetical protein
MKIRRLSEAKGDYDKACPTRGQLRRTYFAGFLLCFDARGF